MDQMEQMSHIEIQGILEDERDYNENIKQRVENTTRRNDRWVHRLSLGIMYIEWIQQKVYYQDKLRRWSNNIHF